MKDRSFTGKTRKGLAALLSALLLTGVMAQTALAATTSYINSISITVDVDVEPGEPLINLETGYTDEHCEVMIPNNERYELVSAKWSSEPDEARLGGTYTMKITLEPMNDYKFSGSYSSNKVRVKGADFVSAQRSSSRKLVVTVKTRPAEGEMDPPEDAYWESTLMDSTKLGVATWDSVEEAAYEAYLYRGSRIVHKVTGLHTTSYNFYPYMTVKGSYTFRVRSIPASDEVSKYASRSDWMISDEVYLEEEYVSDGSGKNDPVSSIYPSAPQTNEVGWIEAGGNYFFRYPNGDYVRDNWAEIAGKWYLFDTSGAMLKGWQQRDNAHYFLGDDGAMVTGWYQENGLWYYLYDNGAMGTGWLNLGEQTYYLMDNGVMATGWQEIENKTYYFYPDGHMAVNETVDGLFYVDMNGVWRP